jgi:hypothetical protein
MQATKKRPALTDAWIRERLFNGWVSQSDIAAAREFLEGERRRDDKAVRKVLKAPKK